MITTNTFLITAIIDGTSYWLVPSASLATVIDGKVTPTNITCKAYKLIGAEVAEELSADHIQYRLTKLEGTVEGWQEYKSVSKEGVNLTTQYKLLEFKLIVDGKEVDTKTISITKDGDKGEDAIIYKLVPSTLLVHKISDYKYTPAYITCKAYSLKGTAITNISTNCILYKTYSESGTVSAEWKVYPLTVDAKIYPNQLSKIDFRLVVNNAVVDTTSVNITNKDYHINPNLLDSTSFYNYETDTLTNNSSEDDKKNSVPGWTDYVGSYFTYNDIRFINGKAPNTKAFYYSGAADASKYHVIGATFLTGLLKPDTWYILSFYTKSKDDLEATLNNYLGGDLVNQLCSEAYFDEKLITGSTLLALKIKVPASAGEFKRHYYRFKTKSTLPDRKIRFEVRAVTSDSKGVFCMPKLEEGLEITDWCLSETDRLGCNIRLSEFAKGIQYRNDEKYTAGLRYIDICIVTQDSTHFQAYKCIKTYKPDASSPAPKDDKTHWQPIKELPPIYTPLILADNAYIKFQLSNALKLMNNNGEIKAGMQGINSNTEYTIWSGSDTPANANFKVDGTGKLTANNANIIGTIKATTGNIGGFTLGSNMIYSNEGEASLNIANNFKVDGSGYLQANNANINGYISALGGNFGPLLIVGPDVTIKDRETGENIVQLSSGSLQGIDQNLKPIDSKKLGYSHYADGYAVSGISGNNIITKDHIKYNILTKSNSARAYHGYINSTGSSQVINYSIFGFGINFVLSEASKTVNLTGFLTYIDYNTSYKIESRQRSKIPHGSLGIEPSFRILPWDSNQGKYTTEISNVVTSLGENITLTKPDGSNFAAGEYRILITLKIPQVHNFTLNSLGDCICIYLNTGFSNILCTQTNKNFSDQVTFAKNGIMIKNKILHGASPIHDIHENHLIYSTLRETGLDLVSGVKGGIWDNKSIHNYRHFKIDDSNILLETNNCKIDILDKEMILSSGSCGVKIGTNGIFINRADGKGWVNL